MPALLLPFFFVLDNSLLMMGSVPDIMMNTLFAIVGVCLMSFSLIGSIRDRLEIVERTALFVAAVLFIFPDHMALIFALVLLLPALIRPVRRALSAKSKYVRGRGMETR